MNRTRLGGFCLLTLSLVVCTTPAPAADARGILRAMLAPATQPLTTRPAAERFEATDRPLNLKGATGRTADRLKAFDHPPERFAYTLQLVADEEDLRVYRLTYPSPFQSPWPVNNVVPAELYLPKAPKGKVPAAIVLDILNGSAVIPRGLARGLAAQGVVALFMPQPCYGERRPPGAAHTQLLMRDPATAIDGVRQTVMDVRRAKAILAARPEVDPGRIALTGVSLGGIMTALAAGVDGEFYRVVPILAGGDLTAIVFHAQETRLIRTALGLKGMSRADTEKLLAPVDPLAFAARIDPRTCLMMNAAKDEVIPRAATDALNKAIGGPKILWTPVGHYSSAMYLPNIRQRTIEFILGKDVDRLDF